MSVLAEGVPVPVNGTSWGGFATEPEEVGANGSPRFDFPALPHAGP
jgi:hypothetical protein